MPEALIVLDPDTDKSLQQQIREKIVHGILQGSIPPGHRMPSSRKLAQQLSVARNTVVLAYQQLVDDGFLVTRQRSGFFVRDSIPTQGGIGDPRTQSTREDFQREFWLQRFNSTSVNTGYGSLRNRLSARPQNWLQYPYPFVSGEYDPRLYPSAEWRECARDIFSTREVNQWATLGANDDDKQLIEQICTRILPRRGIYVDPAQVMLTCGIQQSCYLLSQLFVNKRTRLAMVRPACPETEEMFSRSGASITPLEQDPDGPRATDNLLHCNLWYLEPNAQMPTGVTTSLQRRRQLLEQLERAEGILVENDCDHDFFYHGNALPPMKSMNGGERVVYLYEFPKVIDPGQQLGIVVASRTVIKRLRGLRFAVRERLPAMNQRLLAKFIAAGYLDVAGFRITQALKRRWQAVGEALMYHLTKCNVRRSVCGTACLLELPAELSARELVRRAEKQGILIEAVSGKDNCVRIGYAAIGEEKIEPGIRALAAIIKDSAGDREETLESAIGTRLDAGALRKRLCDAVMMGTNALGESYRIELHADGTMLGYSRNDVDMDETDTGRWWLDGDQWVRQWRNWSYGRKAAFHVVAEGSRLKLFGTGGNLIDTAFLAAQAVEEPA
ncbi:PLP-dependent aminotransferase family protein [Biformimicrobium ophioploci]|uniref:PLP-dependent aminotransferase family protein n=1 Tax=Biformimicrobium ophioploci TaxID=3036711 RepID=A0ABQ6M0I0_9GAMM|nr:PLP-dependent aminotransferase family protein [Microbulbifer sp. NKW57]GMG87814.1 PLP-dependent aminotransferase family protein [Microbulbifer sp. NKW57]